ncbi:glycoside hydrolase family 113 [Kitasatospora viridis]|nr:hypothetical protein [Kitasatospora viridis]
MTRNRFRALTAGLTVLLLAAVSGCALGTTDAGPPPPPIPVESDTPAAPADAPSAASTPTSRVHFPWQPGKPELGIQVFWADTSKDTDQTVQLKINRMIDYVLALDANSISISFPFNTAGPSASAVSDGSDTPSPARLAMAVRSAKAAGLRVTVRPTLDESSLTAVSAKEWRGTIHPSSPAAWFQSYDAFLAPYLKEAQQDKVDTFVIGTEFTSMQPDPRWAETVNQAKTIYSGELTYAANWDSYVADPINIPVSRIGVDAYPPLKNVPDSAGIQQLVDGWNSWLDGKATGPLPNALFYEVDAPAENGAYAHPGVWGNGGGNRNLTTQANWFAAACQVAKDRHLSGLYWWRYDLHQDPQTADPQHDRSDSWLGRPAAQTIRTCFDSWATGG